MLESRQFPEYLTSIRERGFVEVPGAFASGSIDEITAAIEPGFRIPTVNGRIGYVQCENTRFLSSALSWNREIIEIFTDPAVIELAEIYSDAPVHLSNYRIYRAFSSPVARMHWHVYNKTDTYNSESEQFETRVVRKDKGLILILYLSDVKAGGLQLIEGSHTWSFADEKESWDDRERDFIDHAVIPSVGDHPKSFIFLTCDAFGVLPPVARLTPDQAMYHFLSGYTAKVAGTEAGVTEPQATLSACFGAPFLPLPATTYATMLGEKMAKHQAACWLINTGWSGGGYGVGQRMNIHHTRAMVTAALNGTLAASGFDHDPVFGVQIPKACPGVPPGVLIPRNTWPDKNQYDRKAKELARLFNENFASFRDVQPNILAAAPAA